MDHLQPEQFHALIHAFSSIGDEVDVLAIAHSRAAPSNIR
jgi:hypothetical protein